jgi:hypothetical protein
MRPFRLRLALVCPLLGAAPLVAQSDPVTIGVKAGVNVANASVNPALPADFSKSSRTGFIGGISAELKLAEPLSLQLETLYTQKGFEVSGATSSAGTRATATYKFDYVEVPLTLKATFGSGPIRPYVFAGPNVGFRVAAKAAVPGGSVDFKDETKLNDVALDFGAGIVYQVDAKTALVFDVRYSLGLTNVITGGDPGSSSKSRDVKLLFGVNVGLK